MYSKWLRISHKNVLYIRLMPPSQYKIEDRMTYHVVIGIDITLSGPAIYKNKQKFKYNERKIQEFFYWDLKIFSSDIILF